MTTALRIAPERLLPGHRLSSTAGEPGWVRLRHASALPEPPELCVARQAALLSLPVRLGFSSPTLVELACLARGDAACEYVVHCGGTVRWSVVAATAIVAGGVAVVAGQGAPGSAALGACAGAIAYAVERTRARHVDRATRVASSQAFRWLVNRASPQVAAGYDAGSTAPAPSLPVLEREGDVWRIAFHGTTVRMRHSRGMALLSHLVRNAGHEIPVQALDSFVPSAGGGVSGPIDATTLPPDGMSQTLGDAGPVLDARARAEYRQRLAELRAELDDAERCNDLGRADAVRAEMERLEDELSAATGLGGRTRRVSSDVERIRVAVTRRIRAAIEQIARHHPALGEHLSGAVRTGLVCCYVPSQR